MASKTPTIHDFDIMARTLWGEARGEGLKGMRAVAHVIMNRFRDERWPDTIAKVCQQRFQFSCWNINQPARAGCEAVGMPALIDLGCYPVAVAVACGHDREGDLTGSANHYLTNELMMSEACPSWAKEEWITEVIGRHTFLYLPAGA